jgi:hypothetical protein
MTGPLAFAFTTMPVSCWPAKPSPLPVPRATCQVCDWHSSWHALTDGLALILALALCWPSTPTPTLGVHDVLCSWSLVFAFGVLSIRVHGPSCSHLGSFAFTFTVPRVCICGLAFVALRCVHVRVCGLAFVFVFAIPCICVCSLVFMFVFAVPRIRVRIRSPSCSCLCSQSLVFVFVFAVPCVRVHVHSPSRSHS